MTLELSFLAVTNVIPAHKQATSPLTVFNSLEINLVMIKQMGWIEQTCDDQRKPTDVKDTLVTDEYIASEITVPFVRYIYTGRSIYKCQP